MEGSGDNKLVLTNEIRLLKGYIKTKDNFLDEINKTYCVNLNEKPKITSIIIIKNYISTEEFDKIFSGVELGYTVNNLIKINL